jgi:hypothetical protein
MKELNHVAKVEDFARRLTKDRFRFVVGIPGKYYSAVWFAHGKKNSYYVGARSIGGSLKISLHDDCNCRLAIPDEGVTAMKQQGLDAPDNRAFVEWYRKPAPEEGANHIVSLIFPTDYLRLPLPEASYKKPVLIIQAAPPGKAIEVGFFSSREADVTLELKFLQTGKPLCRTTLENGETLWLVIREREFDRAVIPSEERWAEGERFHDKQTFVDESVQLNGLMSMLWDSPKDEETLRVIEIGGVAASVQGGKTRVRIEPAA